MNNLTKFDSKQNLKKMAHLLTALFFVGFLSFISCGNPQSGDKNQEKDTPIQNDTPEASPGTSEAQEHMMKHPVDSLIRHFEDPGRVKWQKPGKVISLLIDTLDNAVVMDLGAGSGYFTFRLAGKVNKVIAADVSKEFLDHIRKKMRNTPEELSGKIEIRKVPFDDPQLDRNEIDRFLTVNTYHHIKNRPRYFSKVKKGLKPYGKAMIVDFFKKETPMGPPVKMRIKPGLVVMVLEKAGFKNISVNDSLLPYQYIVTAGK